MEQTGWCNATPRPFSTHTDGTAKYRNSLIVAFIRISHLKIRCAHTVPVSEYTIPLTL